MFLKNEFLCLLLIYRLLSHQLHKVSNSYVFLSLYNFFIYTRNVNFKLQVIDYVVGDYTLVLVENSISIHLFFFNSWLLTEDIAVFIPFCSCRAFAIIIQHSCYFILCLYVTAIFVHSFCFNNHTFCPLSSVIHHTAFFLSTSIFDALFFFYFTLVFIRSDLLLLS